MSQPTQKEVHSRIDIGWCEYINLPEWKVRNLKAKIDTGARTSSLHVDSIRLVGPDTVTFEVVLSRRRRHRRVSVEVPVVRTSWVRSANSEAHERFVVRTLLRFGGIQREIEVNLVNRGGMIFRMLLGRSALEGFRIDASQRYKLGKPKKHKAKGETRP